MATQQVKTATFRTETGTLVTLREGSPAYEVAKTNPHYEIVKAAKPKAKAQPTEPQE